MSEKEITTTYHSDGHPIIGLDKHCVACTLGENNVAHNERHEGEEKFTPHYAIPGAGPLDLDKVRLIVISDYPGHYETQSQEPMFDITRIREERKKNRYQKTGEGILHSRNAGCILRMSLNLMYGIDTYEECWITNALKCNPVKVTPHETKHLKVCALKWLSKELYYIDQFKPYIPILIAGNQAFKAMKYIYKDKENLLKEYGLQGCRRRTDIKLGEHPAIFTFNPAVAARSEPRIETAIRENKGKTYITTNDWLYPLLPGSPLHKFIGDLSLLNPYLNNE